MKISQVHKLSMSSLIYGSENGEKSIYPLYILKYEFERVIDLLRIGSDTLNEDNEEFTHYALIRALNKLPKSKSFHIKHPHLIS